MLQIHFSNRYETLTRLLLGNLRQDPRSAAGAFSAAQVIVPSQAVARSLTLAIADHDGICANVNFDYLARWLWRQISHLVPGVGESSPFEPEILVWRIYRALGDRDFVAAYPRLQGYVLRADELMRYELACRHRFFVQNRGERRNLGCALEGAPPGHHLIEHRAEGKNVGAGIELLPFSLLRRHVSRCADD